LLTFNLYKYLSHITATLFLSFVLLWTESSESAKVKPQVKLNLKKNSRIQIKRLKGKGAVHQLSNTLNTNSFFVNNQTVCLLCAITRYIYVTLLIHSAGRKKAKNAKPPTKDKVDSMVE
jgi:hypothetical protein